MIHSPCYTADIILINASLEYNVTPNKIQSLIFKLKQIVFHEFLIETI